MTPCSVGLYSLSPVPVDQHLPLDLVVVSHWQAEASENDGDCDDHVDAKDTVEIHSDHSSSLQKAPPKAAASPQDQSVQSKRYVGPNGVMQCDLPLDKI